jgi:hypothetical protein
MTGRNIIFLKKGFNIAFVAMIKISSNQSFLLNIFISGSSYIYSFIRIYATFDLAILTGFVYIIFICYYFYDTEKKQKLEFCKHYLRK